MYMAGVGAALFYERLTGSVVATKKDGVSDKKHDYKTQT